MDSVVKEGSIGSVLFKSRIITELDIERALEEQKVAECKFGEALIRLGIVTQEDIDWALSNQLNIPFVRLKKDMIDPGAVALVDKDLARRYTLVPVIRAGDELSIVTSDPLNITAIEAVEEATGCTVSVSIGLIREIREMLDILYGPVSNPETVGFTSNQFSSEVMDAINGDLTEAKLLDHLLLLMVRCNLPSLSLQPAGDFVRLTIRSSGTTEEIGRLPFSRYPQLAQRIRKVAGIGTSTDTTARGRLGFRSKDKSIQFLVLLMKTLEGDFITFKQEVSGSFPDKVSDLGLSLDQEEVFNSFLCIKSGLLLFVVKDTLERCRFMDLFLDHYNTAGKTVLLLGEGLGRGQKRFPRIALHDWPPHEASTQLQTILEHDPDLVAMEEITESHAFVGASKAALRGKVVAAGVPWNGTAEAMRHLFWFRQRNNFILNVVRGMVVCTSVMTLCPHCRESTNPDPEELLLLPDDIPADSFFRGAGCPACNNSGLQGKKYLVETVLFDKALNELFASAQDSNNLLERLREKGEISVRQKGAELLSNGEISPQEYISSLIH